MATQIIVLTPEDHGVIIARLTKLEQNVTELQTIVEATGSQLSIKQFCTLSNLSRTQVRGLISKNQLAHSQKGERARITIPSTELLKFRQL